MTAPTPEQLAELRKLAEAATLGPWGDNCGDIGQLTDGGQGYPLDFYPDSKEVVMAGECYCGAPGCLRISDPDFAFIAAANPQVVLQLLNRIAELESALKKKYQCADCGADLPAHELACNECWQHEMCECAE